MKIHFVCAGNSYRSRLAEAYLKSKKIPRFEVSSSGLIANRDDNGPVSWLAARIMLRKHLISFMSYMWTQTTTEMLQDADFVIFLGKDNYTFARKYFRYNKDNHEVWDIPDLDQFTSSMTSIKDELARIKATDHAFWDIKKNVDRLIAQNHHSA